MSEFPSITQGVKRLGVVSNMRETGILRFGSKMIAVEWERKA